MLTRTRAALALIAGTLLAVALPAAALAEDPLDLGNADVVDTAGVLDQAQANEIIAALDSLYARSGIQLVVVYVSTFTGATDAVDWADTTAIDNGFGANDVLLAVAIDDSEYALSIDSDFVLSDSQVSDAERAIEAELRDGQWAEAAIAGAQSLEAAATGVVGPGPDQTSEPTPPTTSGGGIPILPIVGGVAVVGVGIFAFSRIRKRSKEGAATADPTRMSQKQLDTRAGSLLVQLDDAVKTSEQELGFAVAQFGEKATADFAGVLQSAKSKVAEAFALKQKLDDAQPESDDEKRSLTTRIIELCEAADAELDSQADAFDALRELEKNAPKALEEVTAAAAKAAEHVTASTAEVDTLRKKYAASAIAPIADNPAQAAKLLDYADAAAERARDAITAGKSSEAAIAVREAQAAVGQADQLATAIDTLGADLARASASLDALVTEVTSDVAEARRLEATSTELTAAIDRAQSALSAAEASRTDPVAAVARLTEANTSLDTVFAGVRDAQAQAARARSQLDPAIAAARAQIQSAADFITTRRGAVGEPARTRVAEADRHLQQAIALADSDPVGALTEAQRASELGASAFSLARNDVDRYSSAVDYGGSNWPRGTDGADLGGLLGGLIGGMIGSSGGRSGGWSGGGGGGSWSSSRSGRTGSFGGSSRSGRRSSSGSSGRGRSRGGRF